MGICCMHPRGPEKQSKFDADAYAADSVNPKASYVKKIKGLRGVPSISTESFQQLHNLTISKIYKKMSPATECNPDKYYSIFKVIHVASDVYGLMKVVPKKHLEDANATGVFFEMIAIQKSLDHPNIAKIHDLLEDDNNFYLIYEALEGDSLYDRLKKGKYLSEDQVLHIMTQVLSAVSFMQRKSIVNGNISLENFVFVTTKEDYTVKLLDFFCAQRLNREEKSFRKVPPNPYYAAPEAINKQGYDRKSEMWSCGVLMHALFDINARLKSKQTDAKFEAYDHEITLTGKYWDQVSSTTKRLIMSLLSDEQSHRPSASEVLQFELFQKKQTNKPYYPNIADMFKTFKIKNRLHKYLRYFIVDRVLHPDEKLEYRNFFHVFDKNYDGIISKSEMMQKYSKIRNDPISAKREIDAIFAALDEDKTELITFTEFLMIVVNKQALLTKSKLAKTFKLLDLDRSGNITKEELALSLGMGQISDDEWDGITERIDTNSDRQISLQELSDFLCSNEAL